MEDGFGDFGGHGDDGGVIPFLPGLFEAGPDRLQAEDFEFLLLGFPVFLEFLQESPFPEFLQIGGLVGIGDIPAVFGLGPQCRIVFGQVAQLLEVGREILLRAFN